jgi:S1-C subfamily serine protease
VCRATALPITLPDSVLKAAYSDSPYPLGASVVSGAMVFPPAIGALSIVERGRTGESFDLIIGVDGQRIRYIPHFQAAISNLRDGDVIYLTLVRDGKRLQMPMRIAQRSASRQ